MMEKTRGLLAHFYWTVVTLSYVDRVGLHCIGRGLLKSTKSLLTYFVKGLQRGREHSSDLMIERVFSNLFFVKHQNLFPQNSCILPIKSIKTLRINCYIFCMFLKRGGQWRIKASPKFESPVGGGERL